jgi:hypothetical protein
LLICPKRVISKQVAVNVSKGETKQRGKLSEIEEEGRRTLKIAIEATGTREGEG